MEHANMAEVTSEETVATFKRTEYYVLYKRRFLVLVILSLALFVNGEVWMTFGSVTKQSMLFFDANDEKIIFFSNLFLIAYSLAAIPCLIIPQFIGSRYSLIIGCGLNLVGCVMRLVILPLPATNPFKLSTALFGNCCFGFSMAFLFSLPTLISSVWFGENERSLSTAVPLMANCFGVGIGYISIFLLINQSQKIEKISQSFTYVFIYEFILSLISLIGAIIFVEAIPPSPPSYSEKERIKNTKTGSLSFLISSTFHSIIQSFTNSRSIIALISYTFNYSVYVIMFTYLTEIVDNFVKNQNSITGYIGALGVIIGGFNTLFAGFVMERTKNNYNNTIGMLANIIPAFPLLILLILCLVDKLSNTGAIVLLVWFLAFAPTFMSIGAEILAEVTYPVHPNISSSEALIFGNSFGAIVSSLFSIIKGDAKFITVISFCIILYAINTFLLNRKFTRTRVNPT